MSMMLMMMLVMMAIKIDDDDIKLYSCNMLKRCGSKECYDYVSQICNYRVSYSPSCSLQSFKSLGRLVNPTLPEAFFLASSCYNQL